MCSSLLAPSLKLTYWAVSVLTVSEDNHLQAYQRSCYKFFGQVRFLSGQAQIIVSCYVNVSACLFIYLLMRYSES